MTEKKEKTTPPQNIDANTIAELLAMPDGENIDLDSELDRVKRAPRRRQHDCS